MVKCRWREIYTLFIFLQDSPFFPLRLDRVPVLVRTRDSLSNIFMERLDPFFL